MHIKKNVIPSKYLEHDKTDMFPLRSETTTVFGSIRAQSATNLWTGSQNSCSSFFWSYRRITSMAKYIRFKLYRALYIVCVCTTVHTYIHYYCNSITYKFQQALENMMTLDTDCPVAYVSCMTLPDMLWIKNHLSFIILL